MTIRRRIGWRAALAGSGLVLVAIGGALTPQGPGAVHRGVSGTVLGRLPAGVRPSDLNVLLVTLDTTRADHVHAYGRRSADTPNLARLAREGTLFDQAASVVPLTVPAHASLLTGVLPFTHGIHDNLDVLSDRRQPSLGRVLKPHGFQTAAFISSMVIGAHAGLTDGFDLYDAIDSHSGVVVGDHGEGLGEHGEKEHGLLLYESTLHVPLIVRTPYSATSGRRVGAVVRSVDVMPTVLDLLGITRPAGVQGVTLTPLMTGVVQDLDLEAYAETFYPKRFGWSELRSLRAGRYKLVLAPRTELYDLAVDPAELRNPYGARPHVARAMTQHLRALAHDAHGAAGVNEHVGIGRDRRDELAALGYVSGALAFDHQLADPDPKDQVERFNTLVDQPSAQPMTGHHPRQ